MSEDETFHVRKLVLNGMQAGSDVAFQNVRSERAELRPGLWRMSIIFLRPHRLSHAPRQASE